MAIESFLTDRKAGGCTNNTFARNAVGGNAYGVALGMRDDPDDASLAATFPHHYHQEPDIKHNRLPASGITFQASNLPILISECVSLADELKK